MKHKRASIVTVVLVILIHLMTSCNSGSSNRHKRESYQETKMTLKEKEKQNPTSFLSTEGSYRKNLIGKWVLEGTISNLATLATYKDVVLKVNFYSKTKAFLGSEKHVIYEYFPSKQKKSFKIKTNGYTGTSSIGWSIEKASPTNF